MTDFEREIVRCLNSFFKTHHIPGFAYRSRQHANTNGEMDVLADSPDPGYCLAIKCKSIIDQKLYFSQHFHAGRNNVHPVDAIADLLAQTKRAGFLAVEFRRGPGRAGDAFLIPWPAVVEHFRKDKGITPDDARSHIVLGRTKDGYLLESLDAK